MGERRTNEERSRRTREALVSAARHLFEERGYASTPADDIAAAAGVTRGALYHHFGGKRELFRAVIEDIEEELADHVGRTAEKQQDPWEAFVAGWLSFLEISPTPGIGHVLMVEGPAVLGYQHWQQIDDGYFLPTITAALERLMRRGVITRQPVEPLARVLLTISNALGTLIAQSPDPESTRAEVMPVWAGILNGLRK